jgi:hypothetical protein
MNQTINDRAYNNLCLLGTNIEDARYIISNTNALLLAAIKEDDEGVQEIEHYLSRAIRHTGIDEVLYDNGSSLTCEQAFEAAYKEMSQGKVIGVTGKPGSGKSSFLKSISRTGGAATFDEFWTTIEGYEEKIDLFERLTKINFPIAIAACHLDRRFVDLCFHIQANPEKRVTNLKERDGNLSDRLRAKYFSAFELHDDILFGLEKMHAEYAFDSGDLSY